MATSFPGLNFYIGAMLSPGNKTQILVHDWMQRQLEIALKTLIF
jgi:hypothetical protein